MYEFFASRQATNSKQICIGSLTSTEAEAAREFGLGDGFGYYLFVADSHNLHDPIEILARVVSEEAAHSMSAMMELRPGAET